MWRKGEWLECGGSSAGMELLEVDIGVDVLQEISMRFLPEF